MHVSALVTYAMHVHMHPHQPPMCMATSDPAALHLPSTCRPPSTHRREGMVSHHPLLFYTIHTAHTHTHTHTQEACFTARTATRHAATARIAGQVRSSQPDSTRGTGCRVHQDPQLVRSTGCGLAGCGLAGCGLTGCGLTGCGLTGCGLTRRECVPAWRRAGRR